MRSIYELLQIANRLRAVTEVNSISPEDTFGLQSDVLAYIAKMEQSADGLGIRKVYKTKAEMEADTEPVGTNGQVLRYGQLVSVYDADNKTSSENGNIYAWQKPGWLLMGNISCIYELKEKIEAEVIRRKDDDDELLKRMQGTSDNSVPYTDPFKLITFTNSESESGNAWNDFNSWLDGLHVDDGNPDYQKAGFFRVKLSGQYYEVVNYIVSWAEGWFIQVVFGHAKVSGSVIGSSGTYTILERSYKDGKWEDWTDRLEKNNVYQVPGNFDEVSTSATDTFSSAMQLGDASKLYEAITTGKVIKDENRVITNILLTSTNNEYALIYDHTTGYTSIFIRFSDNHQNYITISRLTINRIEDNLDSRSTQQALSANQGRILREMIENIQINGGSVIIIE